MRRLRGDRLRYFYLHVLADEPLVAPVAHRLKIRRHDALVVQVVRRDVFVRECVAPVSRAVSGELRVQSVFGLGGV